MEMSYLFFYCELYFLIQVHRLMLQDEPRNDAYRRAVFKNKDFIKGKIVLDVGAGTGILSIFCAQAGASKVYAVEASGLYRIAEEVVKENKLEDIIEVCHNCLFLCAILQRQIYNLGYSL